MEQETKNQVTVLTIVLILITVCTITNYIFNMRVLFYIGVVVIGILSAKLITKVREGNAQKRKVKHARRF